MGHYRLVLDCGMHPKETGEDALPNFKAIAGREIEAILVSSGILLRAEGQTVFYTGDVNFDDQTIMEAAVFPDEKIDVLIMECTRGDHAKSAGWTRPGEERRLADAIATAFERRSCVLIP